MNLDLDYYMDLYGCDGDCEFCDRACELYEDDFDYEEYWEGIMFFL